MPEKDYVLTIPYHKSSTAYFVCLQELGGEVWLDSGKPLSNYGRYDILTAAPTAVLRNPSQAELEHEVETLTHECPDDLKNPDIPFAGGIIGYLNYEYNAQAFGLNQNESERPSVFGIYHWALIQDHKTHQTCLVFHPQCSATLKKRIITMFNTNIPHKESDETKHAEKFKVKNFIANLSQENYLHHVKQIKDHIVEGDCYQVNFAQRFSGDFTGSRIAAYMALREVLPSPFSAYLNITDDTILCLSPERFINIDQDKHAFTQPIKGTAPRGKTPIEDKKLASILAKSPKNQAENVMIVDLLRNDFSQSCEPFSVTVPKLFALESFANVHHLVSTVEGNICDDVSAIDFLLKCFPGGSITGAPKKRAMEIIQSLEDAPRNIYCGSVCYFSANNRIDSNIAIRTVLISEDHVYCWGGGGIVADSTAKEEYQESLNKIQVLIDVLN